jgi:pentatricopeptide repeat protein
MPDKKDVQAWTAMINAYGVHGQGHNALSTFGNMTVAPNATIFLSVISACSQQVNSIFLVPLCLLLDRVGR